MMKSYQNCNIPQHKIRRIVVNEIDKLLARLTKEGKQIKRDLKKGKIQLAQETIKGHYRIFLTTIYQ